MWDSANNLAYDNAAWRFHRPDHHSAVDQRPRDDWPPISGAPRVAPAVGDVNGDGFADFHCRTDVRIRIDLGGGSFLFYGCGNGLNNSAVTPGCPADGHLGPYSCRLPQFAMLGSINPNGLSSVVVNAPSCTSGWMQSPVLSTPTMQAWSRSAEVLDRELLGSGGAEESATSIRTATRTSWIGTWDFPQYAPRPRAPLYYTYTGGGVLFTGSSTGLSVTGAVTRTPSCNGGICTPLLGHPCRWPTGVLPGTPFLLRLWLLLGAIQYAQRDDGGFQRRWVSRIS